MKALSILPDGKLIKGGRIEYDISKYGEVNLDIRLIAHYFFSDHEIKQSGTYRVDPKLVLSQSIKWGSKVTVGNLQLQITEMKPSDHVAIAQALLTLNGQLAHGTATVDLYNEVISFKRITAEGEIFGQKITLEAVY